MKLCMWHLARPRPRRWLTTLRKAAYSDSSATKTYIVKSLPTYSPIPVSQVCSTPASLSTNSRTGKFFFCRIFYPWMVPTLDQPGRQTWRDTRIPRPRRTLVSTPLLIVLPQLIPTPKHRWWPKRLRFHPRIPQRSSNSFLGRTHRYTVPSRIRHRCTPLGVVRASWTELPTSSFWCCDARYRVDATPRGLN